MCSLHSSYQQGRGVGKPAGVGVGVAVVAGVGVTVGDGDAFGTGDAFDVGAAAVGVGVGVGLIVAFALAYASAADTRDSRRARSVHSRLVIARESAFTAMVTIKPITKTMICERRLYQPDTRSIEELNQSSMFCRTCVMSFPAASTSAVSASLTSLEGKF